jgi:coenzyme F420-dependent glucose-6-phosphate dehydrogenase
VKDALPPLRLGYWLSSEEHDPRALVSHAVLAEASGFTTAMISDHLRPWVPRQHHAPHVWTTIGAVAQATDAIEIGTGVTAMVHRQHPLAVAQAGATAAVLSDDRFFLGVGTGERLNEQAFGQRWPRAGERREQMAEAIDIIRRLWHGEEVSHRGTWWNVENLALATLPAKPPKILVAASGKRSAALAGEIGDGMVAVTADGRLAEVFRRHAPDRAHAVGQIHLSVAPDVDAAREQAWQWWPQSVVPPRVYGELARPQDFDALAEAIGPSTIGEQVVCAREAGPVIAAIDRFIGAGYDTVYLHQIGPDQARLTSMAASELLPHYLPI